MEKTDTGKSPLLKPVVERDYTKGININIDNSVSSAQPAADTQSQAGAAPQPGATAQSGPSQQKFNIPPPDNTKEFSFDAISEDAADVNDGDAFTGASITSASAKTFTNFVGDAIQMYLPKLTYGYSKVDIEDIIINIEKGLLTNNWLDAFNRINQNTWEALKISDEGIKMWKKAFKDYLESENIAFANPKNALILATIILLADQGIKSYQIHKANEEYMRQALEKSNPETLGRKPGQTEKTDNNGDKKAA